MQISDVEITQRKALLNFGREDEELLHAHKSFIARRIDLIVDSFYQIQINTPEIALLIGDTETLRLLRNAMRRYILELFEGPYDTQYVNRRLRIGKVHKRIGVAPKLYLSAVWLLQTILNEEIDLHFRKTSENNSCGPRLKDALNKLITLDTELIFDTYISSLVSELTSAREEMANYAANLETIVAQRTHELEELSRKDVLTGLFNKRAFDEHLQRELANAVRHEEPLCLVYIDLNKFKQLNDENGHQVGDEVLATVGRCILSSLRTTDFACRYGGDEFVIIMSRTELNDAEAVCQRLITNFEASKNHEIGLSIGISITGPDKHMEIENLIKMADDQMYNAKKISHESGSSHICTSFSCQISPSPMH